MQGRFWAGFALCFGGVLLTVNAFDLTSHLVSLAGVLCMLGAVTNSTIYRIRMENVTAMGRRRPGR